MAIGLEKSIESEYNGLEPVNEHKFTDEQKNLLYKLGSFEAPYLEEKLLEDGKFNTPEEYQEAFTEFKKYVALSQIVGKNMAMLSKKVDEVWHQFILFTPQYHKFCKEMRGKYLHHVPKTSISSFTPKYRLNFIDSYKEIFGDIPEIWGLNKSYNDPHTCDDPPSGMEPCTTGPYCKSSTTIDDAICSPEEDVCERF